MLNLHCFKTDADCIQTGDLLLGTKPGTLLSVTKRTGQFLDLNIVSIDKRPTPHIPLTINIRCKLFRALADTTDDGKRVWTVEKINSN